METIEFRAWDTIRKQLEYQFEKQVVAEDGTEYSFLAFRFVGNEDWSNPIVSLLWALKHPARYKVMRYTGLKDKNGKKICEGDIVRLHCFNDNLVTATIEWDEYKFIPRIHDKKIKVRGGSHNGLMCSMGEVHSWAGMHSCFSFPRYMEVIGNVYQNFELSR